MRGPAPGVRARARFPKRKLRNHRGSAYPATCSKARPQHYRRAHKKKDQAIAPAAMLKGWGTGFGLGHARPIATVTASRNQNKVRALRSMRLSKRLLAFCRGRFCPGEHQQVAAAAGVSIGSLYQYFPSKEAFVAAVIERHDRENCRKSAATRFLSGSSRTPRSPCANSSRPGSMLTESIRSFIASSTKKFPAQGVSKMSMPYCETNVRS